ncbi:SGNH/GDSL hydrolase family protein [Streptomyces griseiscabiei]|uniref:SGNH/GDSL hydrolase family protein n=1 Tax=Streptomyces griseiscabiei TaxID=2993540 RepID=A0ABU4L3E8_9ACTN|nr:SGNH/GDSL hydrolase family protein [Streptomyces griseiscabiei]MBZ3901338.1 SGNH/GDSL hydrolase family protein [Streptomyces griseiscabiei]MDX2910111.1 SGNH/GDSL hydrolase family protein [Streptomyces griseiscabiei]
MRKPWIVGVAGAVLAALLLGACGDPASAPEEAPPSAAAPEPSSTTRQRAATAPPAEKSGQERPAPGVLYLGDSLATENQKVLGTFLEDSLDARYTSVPYSGTTLCDYLEGTADRSLVPPQDKAAALVRRLSPDYVVLQFWGNAWDYTPCMDGVTYGTARAEYLRRYSAAAERLTEQIADAGGTHRPTIVWVLQGPDPLAPDRIRRVNALYAKQADASGDLVADAGRAVSPAGDRYTWAQYLPCTAYEREHDGYCTQPGRSRTALHHDEDLLHFCLAPTTSKPRPCPVPSPGITRMAREITRAITEADGA